MNNPNITDVTDSPEDWEDFWHSPEKFGTWETKKSKDVNSYVEDVLSGKNAICKRESPLSE